MFFLLLWCRMFRCCYLLHYYFIIIIFIVAMLYPMFFLCFLHYCIFVHYLLFYYLFMLHNYLLLILFFTLFIIIYCILSFCCCGAELFITVSLLLCCNFFSSFIFCFIFRIPYQHTVDAQSKTIAFRAIVFDGLTFIHKGQAPLGLDASIKIQVHYKRVDRPCVYNPLLVDTAVAGVYNK